MLRREIYFIGCLITAIIMVPMISLAASRNSSRHIQEMLAANALILQTRSQEKQSLERDLIRHEQDLAIARQHYLDQQIQLQHLLVALQRLARTPPESILSQPESPERVVRGGILLRAAIQNLEQKLGPLRADLNHFEQLRQNVEARKQALTRLSDELQQQDQDLENLIAQRQQNQPLNTTLSPLPAIGLGELVKKATFGAGNNQGHWSLSSVIFVGKVVIPCGLFDVFREGVAEGKELRRALFNYHLCLFAVFVYDDKINYFICNVPVIDVGCEDSHIRLGSRDGERNINFARGKNWIR